MWLVRSLNLARNFITTLKIKKIFICLILIHLLIPSLFSQCDNFTVETPMDSDVDACRSGGYSAAVVAVTDTSEKINFLLNEKRYEVRLHIE